MTTSAPCNFSNFRNVYGMAAHFACCHQTASTVRPNGRGRIALSPKG
jgi:hypothetical protein